MSSLQTQMLLFDSVELFVHVSVCKHSLNNASDRMHLIDCRKYLRCINRTISVVIFLDETVTIKFNKTYEL